MTRPRVVIIGGGLAGLTVAYRLRDHADVTIFEKAAEPGGKLRSEAIGGFLIEHGPDVFLARKPWARELCEELGLEVQSTNPDVPGSFIRWNGRLHPLPEGFSGLVPTRWGPLLRTSLLSPRGKARLLLEPLIPRRRNEGDETLGAFVRRRLGQEAYERLVHPLLSGIYGGDIDAVSLQATFPRFHELEREFGSLIRGAASGRRARAVGPVFVTLRDGMGALPEALIRASGARVVTGAASVAVSRETGGWRVRFARSETPPDGAVAMSEALEGQAVVVATPAFEAAPILGNASPAIAIELALIPYNSSILVTLGWSQSFPLPGYGYLNPPRENPDVRACTWSSSKITGRAPEPGTLVRLFFGRDPADPWLEASDEDLIARATREVRETMEIDAAPSLTRVTRWPRAQPAYIMGHLDRLSRIDHLLDESPGLFLTGSAYRGVGIPDVVHHANQTAQKVIDCL